MVKRSRLIRADPEYFKIRATLKSELGNDLTDAKITRGISRFLISEKLLPIMVRREKKRRRGGLF